MEQKKVCDHQCVGVLIWRNDYSELLLIERADGKGWAPPAGHLDGDKNSERSAVWELKEETGLDAKELAYVWSARTDNQCSRQDGNWHEWDLYSGIVHNENVKLNTTEVKSFCWANSAALEALAARTKQYLNAEISQEKWKDFPGLEPVWLQLLSESGYL